LFARAFEIERLERLADGLAVAVAISLPWSTSATSILVALWLVALLPTLDVVSVRGALAVPAGGLPVALWGLGLVGMLWGDVALSERIYVFGGFHKLLMIPLLIVQFRRSDKGVWVIVGFVAACTALMAVSWVYKLFPYLPGHADIIGVPVKDYIIQSGEFLLCAYALGHLAIDAWQARERMLAIGLAVLALLFLGNVVYVAASRAMLIVLPLLIVLLAQRRLGWRGGVALLAAGVLLAGAAWSSSSYLRSRVEGIVKEVSLYEKRDAETSAGYRLEFWKKSMKIIAAAPLYGHGTGSTAPQFARLANDSSEISAVVTNNPHNQTLSIAIQFGMLGAAVLFAMWLAHLMVFRGDNLAAWLGLAVVVQTIVASLFNSQLFYFTPGWIYVFGVGVLVGMLLGGKSLIAQPAWIATTGWRRNQNAVNEETKRVASAGAE
jgi:O-antigen ligase